MATKRWHIAFTNGIHGLDLAIEAETAEAAEAKGRAAIPPWTTDECIEWDADAWPEWPGDGVVLQGMDEP